MNWLIMFLPKWVKQMVEILRGWEADDVADAIKLVSLLTAHVHGIDNYRGAVTYGIEMLTEYPDGKVSLGGFSKWGGSSYLGVMRAPRRGRPPAQK